MSEYILISESALDAAMLSGRFDAESGIPDGGMGLCKHELYNGFIGFKTISDSESSYFALIGIRWIGQLVRSGAKPAEIYRRIARVLKGLMFPPVHLPRQWSEYHFRNLLAFFALPRDISSCRWVVELDSARQCARFDFLSGNENDLNLANFLPKDWPPEYDAASNGLLAAPIEKEADHSPEGLAKEVDLQVIGSGSVVNNRSYEEWIPQLSSVQKSIIDADFHKSMRIIGPAGSGKTLSLCMRVIQIARDPDVIAKGQRILLATHSWAMSERVDGILLILNGGEIPAGVTVFPLLALLEEHAGRLGQHKVEVIGDDSSDGRVKGFELIGDVLDSIDAAPNDIGDWIRSGINDKNNGRARIDLILNLYEEISGVLSASGVAPDDAESLNRYFRSPREDWMPPFVSLGDKEFVIRVYELFIQRLVDRSAITTDQFVLDSIRVLETFTWRMKKETEGYDYIFVDELQLFDPQERSALELLGRSRGGVPFVTAEDPSQGVFSALHGKRERIENQLVYLDTVHRFDKEIFDFINFIYRKFPLNALPLKIEDSKKSRGALPLLYMCDDTDKAVNRAVNIASEFYATNEVQGQRMCLITLGDVDEKVAAALSDKKLPVAALRGFDDIEKLSYTKKSIVVSPWQFIGGTQFSHVLVLAMNLIEPSSQFGRLREMISVYLSCSRAAKTLYIVSSGYVPAILSEAAQNKFLKRT